MNKSVGLLLGLWVLGTVPVWAQGATTRTELTLEAAVTRAVSRSPEVRSFEAGIAVADGEVISARLPGRFNPGLSFDVGPRFGSVTPTEFNGGVSLALELERPERRSAREQTALLGVRFEQNLLTAAQLRLAQRTRLLYTQFWRNDKLTLVALERQQLAERLAESLKERFKVGSIGLIPVNLAQVEVSQASAERERLVGETEGSRSSLLVTIGDEPDRIVKSQALLPDTPAVLPNLAQIVLLAQQSNPTLQAALTDQARADAQLELAKAEAVPNLTPVVGYRREGTENILLAGLSLPLSLFNRNEGVIASASARRTQTQARVEQTRLELNQQIQENLARYRAAQRVLNIYSLETLTTIEKNLGLLDEAFRAGKIGITDVLIARRDALNARSLVINARADLYASYVILQGITGEKL